MPRTSRLVLTLAGLAVIALGRGAALATSPQGAAAEAVSGRAAIDMVLNSAVQRRDIPGVVAVATDRRGVIYSGAFGAAEGSPSRTLSSDAIFRIASMTKALTSTAAMQLVERRQVSLDDAVSKYFPAFSTLSVLSSFDAKSGDYTVRPATRPVTVRHLFTHTSGLGYDFTSPIVRDFKPKHGDTFAVGPLLFEPGERWLYGTSTEWLGRLVEAVSGQTLEAYFAEHILNPLGMNDTYFNVPEAKLPRLVNTWRRDRAGALTEQPRQAPVPVSRFNGGGGLSSTAGDYIRFVQMVLNDGQLNGTRILSANSVAAMSRNQIGDVGVRAVATAMPARSDDFTFINDNRDKWGLGFLITTDQRPGLRSAGSLSWGGINNTYFWIDRTRGVGGVIMMQFLPFADARALATYEAFEREVYRLVSDR